METWSHTSAVGSYSRFICWNSKNISNNGCFCCVIFSVCHELIANFAHILQGYLTDTGAIEYDCFNAIQEIQKFVHERGWYVTSRRRNWQRSINWCIVFWIFVSDITVFRLTFVLSILSAYSYPFDCEHICASSLLINSKIWIANHQPLVRVRWSNNGRWSMSFRVVTSVFIGLQSFKHPCHSWMVYPKITPKMP